MHPCLICGKRGHSAMYCPKVMDEATAVRLTALGRIPTPTVVRVDDRETPKPERVLGEAVANQIGELVDGLDEFRGIEEMPRPPRDLTAYADAFASAQKRCRHQDVNNVEHRRTWYCVDCRQHLDYDAMRRVRGDNYWWSW